MAYSKYFIELLEGMKSEIENLLLCEFDEKQIEFLKNELESLNSDLRTAKLNLNQNETVI